MHHADVLRKSVEGFTNVDRDPVPGEFDADASHYLFRVALEPRNDDWTLRLGEFIYATRACLNYLITALVRSTGKEEDDTNEFPIYGIGANRWVTMNAASRWEADPGGTIKGKLNNTPTGTKAALKPLQPFYGGPYPDPFQHPLTAIQLLSNTDKHRRLNLLNRVAMIGFVDAAGQPIYEGPRHPMRTEEAYEGDTYTVTLTVSEKLDVDVYLLPSYNVRLDEPPQLFGDVLEAVARINEFIDRWVLPTVRGLL